MKLGSRRAMDARLVGWVERIRAFYARLRGLCETQHSLGRGPSVGSREELPSPPFGLRRAFPRPAEAYTRRRATQPTKIKCDSPALVNPVMARSEAGEDLVARGPHGGGEVVDGHAFADQRGEPAAARGA